jgi:hypothetical protein
MQSLFDEIAGATDAFCERFLNEEYALICRKLTAALARKRPSPLLRGKPSTWAATIVYTAGSINFLFDPSQNPHMSARELSEELGLSTSTLSAKRKLIENALDVGQLDPDYTLPSLVADNPLIWMLEVDGLVMDMRTAPRDIQEAAYDQGLIPYIPADLDEEGEWVDESEGGPRIIPFPGNHSISNGGEIDALDDDEPSLFEGLDK